MYKWNKYLKIDKTLIVTNQQGLKFIALTNTKICAYIKHYKLKNIGTQKQKKST